MGSLEMSTIKERDSSFELLPDSVLKEINTFKSGKIVVAEDQLINLTVLKQQLNELNYGE